MSDSALVEVLTPWMSAAKQGPYEMAEASTYEDGKRVVTETFIRCPGDNVSIAVVVDPATGQPHAPTAELFAASWDLIREVLQRLTGQEVEDGPPTEKIVQWLSEALPGSYSVRRACVYEGGKEVLLEVLVRREGDDVPIASVTDPQTREPSVGTAILMAASRVLAEKVIQLRASQGNPS